MSWRALAELVSMFLLGICYMTFCGHTENNPHFLNPAGRCRPGAALMRRSISRPGKNLMETLSGCLLLYTVRMALQAAFSCANTAMASSCIVSVAFCGRHSNAMSFFWHASITGGEICEDKLSLMSIFLPNLLFSFGSTSSKEPVLGLADQTSWTWCTNKQSWRPPLALESVDGPVHHHRLQQLPCR
jgi:hypothetical protein